MRITVSVCDTCKDKERPVRGYKLSSEGRVKEVDLCEEHAAPLEVFLADTKPRGGARRGRAQTRITTLEDIENSKSN